MKKGSFAIYVFNHGVKKIDTVQGYIFDYGRFRFGIHNIKYMGWGITEISTGMLLGIYADKKKNVYQLLDTNTDLLERLVEKLENPSDFILEAQEAIREFYTVKPAE